jgi:hypothetical protein
MLPIFSLCALHLYFVLAVLKFLFILSDREAGGSTVPPCLLGVRRGTSYLWREFGSGEWCGLVRDEDRTRDETADGSAILRAPIRDRIREREHHLGVPAVRRSIQVGGSGFYLNRTVFPVRGRNRLVQSVSWSSPSSSESDPNSAWSNNFCVLAFGFSFCNSFKSCSKSFELISFKYLFTSTSSGSSLFFGLSSPSANLPSLPDSSIGSPDSKSISCSALGTSRCTA